MDLVNITHIKDLLDCARQRWAFPSVLFWCMELPVLCVSCCLLQEVKAALPPIAFTYIDWVLCEGSPCPSVSPSPPELVVEAYTAEFAQGVQMQSALSPPSSLCLFWWCST